MTENNSLDQQNDHDNVSITVFFPCYNEQENVEKTTLNAVRLLEEINADYEIIIVDDGSSDDTPKIADSIASLNQRIKVIHHNPNLGYGAALQSGFKNAEKPLVFYTDGDGPAGQPHQKTKRIGVDQTCLLSLPYENQGYRLRF
ncbi:MAG: glycosyltransferase family 2 protein [Planctomycetota bacterium]